MSFRWRLEFVADFADGVDEPGIMGIGVVWAWLLVQRLVRALGGSVVVELPAGGIFVVRTTLPAKGERNSIE